jgi:hypothetical protein
MGYILGNERVLVQFIDPYPIAHMHTSLHFFKLCELGIFSNFTSVVISPLQERDH